MSRLGLAVPACSFRLITKCPAIYSARGNVPAMSTLLVVAETASRAGGMWMFASPPALEHDDFRKVGVAGSWTMYYC